jgi:hypothetical protein
VAPEGPPLKCVGPNVVRYANALREVYAAHSSDLEVATLFAEALINRTPWRLWDLDTGGWQLFREVPLIAAGPYLCRAILF